MPFERYIDVERNQLEEMPRNSHETSAFNELAKSYIASSGHRDLIEIV